MKFFVATLLCAGSAMSQAADLTLKLEGVSGSEGQLMIALYNSPDAFRSHQSMQHQRLPLTGAHEAVFKGLAPGRYMVAVYHDRNGNGKLDTNASGMPLEPYGFSRNPSTQYGPPSFDDAAVMLGAEAQSITVYVD